jgi:hypothetical protein
LVRPKLEFIRYTLRSLGWTDIHDLLPYEHRCALRRLDTLLKRRSIMFIFDILSGRMNSPNLLSAHDIERGVLIRIAILILTMVSIARTIRVS